MTDSEMFVTIIGYLASICMVFGYLPQAIATIRIRAVGCDKVIAGCKRMACVYTHSHPAFVLDLTDYLGNLSETESEVGSLPGRIFYHGLHTRCLFKRVIDRGCYA